MNHPVSGVHYLITGFRLISQSGLRRYVAIPLCINMLLFIGLFFLIRHYMSEFNLWFTHFLPTWLHWLSTVLWLLFFISFFLIFIYTFVTVANLISAPFNSLLAEKVEFFLTGRVPKQTSLFENINDVPRIVGRQLAILGYYLPRAIFLLVLFFIPLVQTIAPILWFLFNAWYMTLTYIDYPTDNHRIPLSDVRVWIKQRRFTSLGFGVSVLVATMVPVLNFFIVPAAVAAATQFWVEEQTGRNNVS
jgi:CysZ protein